MDPTVGFVITVKPGDPVRAGEPIASVFARDEAGIAIGMEALREAVVDRRHGPRSRRSCRTGSRRAGWNRLAERA